MPGRSCQRTCPLTYDFSSCFFPKFKMSTKRGFFAGKNQFIWFLRPQNRKGGSSYPKFVQKYRKPWNSAYFGVFLSALGWCSRTVLHTSVPV